MIKKELKDIKEADLQHLIDEQVIENKTLEYKKEVQDSSDSKKKFLASVSSLANASGGDLLIGMEENRDTGAPLGPIKGLEISNPDQEILRLDQIIEDGIEPNIPSSLYDIHPIRLSNSNYVIIIRIRRSWLGPHRVSYQKWNQFYSRSTNRKYRLDVQELRSAFILSETIAEKIKIFQEKRVSDILSNELPIPFYPSPKIVVHLIPLSSFNPGQRYDLEKIASISLYNIQPIGSDTFNHRYNIDGLLTYSAFPNKERSFSYVQLFRNGIIEAVNSELLWNETEPKFLPISALEKELIQSIPNFMQVYTKFNIDFPIFLFVALLDVKGYVIPRSRRWSSRDIYPIDRDVILIPEVIIENFNFDPAELLRPIFDSFWNACGYHRSQNYDKNGKYIA